MSEAEPQTQITTQTIISHADTIAAYPDGEFVVADVEEYPTLADHEIDADGISGLGPFLKSNLKALIQSDVVEYRGWVDTGRGKKRKRVYAVADDVQARAREQIEDRDVLCPCGHAGLENHGDAFACSWPPCDRTFSRAEVTGGVE